MVRQFYRQKAIMPKGYFAAYQVKLDDGRLIFAPRDHDDFIGVRLAAKEAAWDVFFTNAVAAGHITQLEVDTLSDALAETTSAGARRELLEEQIDEACGRALLLWVRFRAGDSHPLEMAGARGAGPRGAGVQRSPRPRCRARGLGGPSRPSPRARRRGQRGRGRAAGAGPRSREAAVLGAGVEGRARGVARALGRAPRRLRQEGQGQEGQGQGRRGGSEGPLR